MGAPARGEGQDFGLGFLLDHGRQLGFAAAGHLVADAALVALVAGLVEHPPLKSLGQVLLGHPVVAIGVGIEVALAMAKALAVAAAILEVAGHIALPFLFDQG